MSNGQLPDYITKAVPNPPTNRTAWYKSTAPTYAGIMLWFVFWQDVPSGGSALPGGTLAAGLGTALLGLVAAALICHFLFYLVPGLLGMKTGLPLYIVGTSTYGAKGGFVMPGFLMGVLQFGWLGVNTYFSSLAVNALFGGNPTVAKIIMVVWAIVAAFVGLKGIQYVAKVATFLPAIPFVILIIMFFTTAGGLGDFDAGKLVDAAKASNPAGTAAPLAAFGVFALMLTYIVGFFATAGAAGADFGMNNPDAKHVSRGGLVGIAGATIFAGGLSLLVAAGAFGLTGKPGLQTASTGFMAAITSDGAAKWMAILLAVAAFPPACFSSFIAANSFKTTLPNVNPFVSVGIGTAVSIVLAVTGWAGDVIIVFKVIGASFGPICGAMMVDYLLSGKQWSGPRAGFNPAGWISWAGGFALGLLDIFGVIAVPAAPVVAFVIGAVLYFVLAKAGVQSAVIPMPAAAPKN
ncbi:MAG TPA: cytosine permease [Planctomycetes bacterium]|nr:cytosine permease [Planctomycetota bacterium]